MQGVDIRASIDDMRSLGAPAPPASVILGVDDPMIGEMLKTLVSREQDRGKAECRCVWNVK